MVEMMSGSSLAAFKMSHSTTKRSSRATWGPGGTAPLVSGPPWSLGYTNEELQIGILSPHTTAVWANVEPGE